MNLSRLNRWTHRWGSIVILIPTAVIIVSGAILQLKKESTWVQPATKSGSSSGATLPLDRVLSIVGSVPEAKVRTWDDIDRLDVRPSKGMIKVRCKNSWEVQIDANNGDILQVAYRRSDLIESIHDGSFFHESARLWIFFPTALILIVLWITGIYLFALPYWAKAKRRRSKASVA